VTKLHQSPSCLKKELLFFIILEVNRSVFCLNLITIVLDFIGEDDRSIYLDGTVIAL